MTSNGINDIEGNDSQSVQPSQSYMVYHVILLSLIKDNNSNTNN